MSRRAHAVEAFETPRGAVAAHEIVTHQPGWLTRPIESVVVAAYSRTAGMQLRLQVPWQAFTTYCQRTWPEAGIVCGVVLENTNFISAYATYAPLPPGAADVPAAARHVVTISTHGGDVLLEVGAPHTRRSATFLYAV